MVHASTTLQQPLVRHSGRTGARFPVAARHRRGHSAAPRYRKRSSASFSTNSSRPSAAPSSTFRHPRALRALPRIARFPLRRHVINRSLFFAVPFFRSLFCRFTPPRTVQIISLQWQNFRPCSRSMELPALPYPRRDSTAPACTNRKLRNWRLRVCRGRGFIFAW